MKRTCPVPDGQPAAVKLSGNEKGFTLIEMAIVLVIIGLILGSVIKGKDLIGSAKQKSFYTNFVKKWELTVTSYYDRTGYVLGDGGINGGTGGADPNGTFDNIAGNAFGGGASVDNALRKVGLEVPTSNTNESGQYSYTGAYSGNRTVTMYLYRLYSHTDGVYANRLYFTGIPTDLAIGLDKMADGQIDARAGVFRMYADNDAPNDGTWPDASTTPVVNASYLINLP